MNKYIYTYMYVCMYIYVFIYMHIHIHTQTQYNTSFHLWFINQLFKKKKTKSQNKKISFYAVDTLEEEGEKNTAEIDWTARINIYINQTFK